MRSFWGKQTTLGIWHWAMYHNEANFSRPFEFLPERWMGDPAFEDDHLDALKPFHFGPRNCLGMKCVASPFSFFSLFRLFSLPSNLVCFLRKTTWIHER